MLFLIGLLVFIAQAAADPDLHCAEQVEMGTPFKICVYAGASDRLNVQTDIARSFSELKQIDQWMSEWRPGTDLSQVNAQAGIVPVRIRKELFAVLQFALIVSNKSQGAFDPTFNAFWGLYSFKKGTERQPTIEEIKERLPLIDYRNVILANDKQTVFLRQKGMKLGLGGLGQGYAVDHLVSLLKKNYSAGFVDGSGDTYFWGKKPNGEMWLAVIRDPRDHSKNILRIYGTDFAITTCGDDEKFFMSEGERIHHIIDPKTGRPARASRQVTVVAKSTMAADAYDTAGFVMGPEGAKKMVEELGFRGIFVSDKGVVLSRGLKSTQTPWGEVYTVEGVLN